MPSSPRAAVKLYDALVAPAMLEKLAPPSVDRCHWTVGLGKPEAADVNDAVSPGCRVWLDGSVKTAGGACTVTVSVCVPLGLMPLAAVRFNV